MPIPGAKYRVVKRNGKKVRLAFVKGKVVEAKNLETGEIHTTGEFAADRKKKKKRGRK